MSPTNSTSNPTEGDITTKSADSRGGEPTIPTKDNNSRGVPSITTKDHNTLGAPLPPSITTKDNGTLGTTVTRPTGE